MTPAGMLADILIRTALLLLVLGALAADGWLSWGLW